MIFPLVLAGHLIGDWVVQTDHQAVWKTQRSWSGWRENQAHMLTYHLTLLVFLVAVWHSWSLAVLMGVSWVTHSIIDRRWPVRWLMEHTGSGLFARSSWGVFVVDQALHISILSVLVAGLVGNR